MLTLSYLEVALACLAQAVLYLGLGLALSQWWHKPSPDPWNRASRDWEGERFGSAMDGSLSRMRWLPNGGHDDEED